MADVTSSNVALAAQPEPVQREITRLCIVTGLTLLQHGSESALVESLTRRLGLALGVRSVEVAIMANALTVTTLSDDHCITTVRRNEDHGINMHMVTEVQRAVLDVEEGRLDATGYRVRLEAIRPEKYPRWLVALMIGFSCACFARLAQMSLPAVEDRSWDWKGLGLTFLASSAAMLTRQLFAARHFNPLVNFFVSAFVATSIAGQGVIYKLGPHPKIAMASCVLLLVPGFPMINSVSDMVKGYINTGLSRGMMAVLLGAATSAGIILAMTVWNVWGWL
ncbi:MAG: threonine/serine exporter family protein [Nibricoccus sp.]